MHVLEPAWEALRRGFDSACLEIANDSRRQLAADLNQVFRRLRLYESEDQWINAVGDAGSKFAGGFAIFTRNDRNWVLRSQQDLNLPNDYSIPVSSTKAFGAAIESGEPVVALRRPGEVGLELSAESNSRAHIFPISNSGRVVAAIYAVEDERLDVNALELVTGMASAVLERQSNQSLHAKILPNIAPAQPAINKAAPVNREQKRFLPAWTDLGERERGLHMKAQRFSRVTVAKLQLNRPEACRAGREQNNLYMFLQSEIDKARENYRKQFMTSSSMIDYLHLELVNAAAEGDDHKLGVDYPGQLV